VIELLRADPQTSGMRMVLLSARVQQGDIERGLEAGADAYLPKPFRATELVELVQKLLG
jgi:CheY-like chemotaxis protein